MKNKYFLTFIDDFLRYGYIYLIKEKSDALEKFKIFKTEVKNQLIKRIKVISSDRGSEYYGKHDVTGQYMGPFVKYLQEYEIIAQYIMPGW